MATSEEEKKHASCHETNLSVVEVGKDMTSNQEVNKIDHSLKEKCKENDYVAGKREVFKKPVFLIGPRKGKTVGKMTVYKSTDKTDNTTEEKEIVDVIEDGSFVPTVIKSDTPTEEKTETDNTPNDTKESQKVSPAQKLNENLIPLPYKEPKWSGIPNDLYKFEVLKNGSILETIDLSSKPYFVFGRLSTCDIHMAHPTVSRFHAVLQFRTDNNDAGIGFYVYDLGSTHGTFLNKYRIKPNMYVRVHVGHLLKLGGSSRLFILQGPEEDMEKESDLTVTELKEKRTEEQRAKEVQEFKELEELRLQQEKEEKDGIDWGMGDDADAETDLSENPFAATQNEELYLDDPKKTLRGWFEREGYDLEYDVEEKGFGQFLCRVEIPVECAKGGTIVAESLVKGKKKEAVVQCALEACRILDRYGLLRQAKHESRKRKTKNWEENDYYDSDEDEFLDRTGTVEKKRQQRMKAAGKLQTQTDTYESLVKKHEELQFQVEKVQRQLDDLIKPKAKEAETVEEEDALDAFMTNLSSEIPDNKLINKLKTELLSLKKEETHVRKLVNIACPASLPKLIEESSPQHNVLSHHKSKLPPSFKRKIPSNLSKAETPEVKLSSAVSKPIIEGEEEEGEEEEDDEEQEEEQERNGNIETEVGLKITDSTKKYNKEVNEQEVEQKEESSLKEQTDYINSQQKNEKSCDHSPDLNTRGNGNFPEGDTAKNTKVIGPTLPPEDFVLEGNAEKRKKRPRQRQNKKLMKASDTSSSSDPNYSMWVPPEDQSGDGRTKLNEKYGY